MIRDAYDLGALGATDEASLLYSGRGWRLWGGRLSALTPDGVRPTPDEEGAVYVLPVEGVELDLSARADLRLARRRRLVIAVARAGACAAGRRAARARRR